jgi:hypothetical protein
VDVSLVCLEFLLLCVVCAVLSDVDFSLSLSCVCVWLYAWI